MFDLSEIRQCGFVSFPDEERLVLLNRQLRYAAERSPYYAEILYGRIPVSGLACLPSLPFTDASVLISKNRRMLCMPAASIARIVSLRTSGSSGKIKRLYFTENDLARTSAFFAAGMSWLCTEGDLCAVLMPCRVPDGIGDLLIRSLNGIGVRTLPLGIPEDTAAVREILLREQPQILVGFPWHLRILSILCPDLRPRAVLLSGDYIPEQLKILIGTRWHTAVTVHFGMTETGYGCAVQHPGSSLMYLRRDELIAEVVDPVTGRPLPSGQTGELVLTTLQREAMPLLRYRTGDSAVLSEEGDIVCISGRLSVPQEFYRLQDDLSRLPWLWDYRVTDGRLFSFVTPEAPADASAQLEYISRLRVSVHTVPASELRLIFPGKRLP